MGSTEALPTIPLSMAGYALRAWRAGDAAALARHADNLEVWQWMSDAFPHPYTREIAEHWVTRGHIDFGGDNWAITFHDEAVGGCGIHPGQAQFRCNAEVGWWLAQEHWGQGVATCVARQLVALAFADPEVTRVHAPVHAGNRRSMRVAEKAGLTLEGVQRKSAIKAGQVIDRHVYSLIREP